MFLKFGTKYRFPFGVVHTCVTTNVLNFAGNVLKPKLDQTVSFSFHYVVSSLA
jgi:hypothetical protein